MRVKVMELDKPNQNGRVYSTKVMEEALKNYRGPWLGFFSSEDMNPNPLNTTHTFTASIEDGFLVADIEILDTPKGKILKETMELFVEDSLVQFVPRGIGNIDKGVITNYELISIDAWYTK